MHPTQEELKHIATQLLAGMLSNPHVYTGSGDEELRGQPEKALILTAIEMAESLIQKVNQRTENSL